MWEYQKMEKKYKKNYVKIFSVLFVRTLLYIYKILIIKS